MKMRSNMTYGNMTYGNSSIYFSNVGYKILWSGCYATCISCFHEIFLLNIVLRMM